MASRENTRYPLSWATLLVCILPHRSPALLCGGKGYGWVVVMTQFLSVLSHLLTATLSRPSVTTPRALSGEGRQKQLPRGLQNPLGPTGGEAGACPHPGLASPPVEHEVSTAHSEASSVSAEPPSDPQLNSGTGCRWAVRLLLLAAAHFQLKSLPGGGNAESVGFRGISRHCHVPRHGN